jgi:hypothetical protein
MQILVLSLTTTMALADHSNAPLLDIHKALPKTAPVIDKPIHPVAIKNAPVTYSPRQKASIAGLKLTSSR